MLTWQYLQAKNDANSGIAHVLAFAASCVMKIMDAATLLSCFQKGGYLADLISLQATVHHIGVSTQLPCTSSSTGNRDCLECLNGHQGPIKAVEERVASLIGLDVTQRTSIQSLRLKLRSSY